MASKVLIYAAAACVGLLGCATPILPMAARHDCDNSGSCKVDVKVEGCTVTAPDVHVFVATNIFWELDKATRDTGWSFPNDPVKRGIWIKDPPQGQFDSPDRQNEWRYKLHNKNTVKGDFKYGVRVVRGSITCELDPIIVNH